MKLKPSKILFDLFLVLLILLISSKVGPPGLDMPEELQHHGRFEPNLCVNLSYNETMMPNPLKHQKSKGTGQEVHQDATLVKVDCSRDLRFVLCLIYALVCTIPEKLSPPRRSICERARDGCERIMTNDGCQWRANLDCFKRPEYGKDPDLLCVVIGEIPHRISTTRQPTFISSPQFQSGWHPEPYGDVLGVKVHGFVYPLEFSVPEGLGYSLEIGDKEVTNCGASCDLMCLGDWQKNFDRVWMGTWRVLCALLCFLAFLTFLIGTDRFRFPEKLMILPVLCALLCFLASLTFSIGTDVFRFPEKLMIWAVLCFFSCSLVVVTFSIATNTFRCPKTPMTFLLVCYVMVALVYVVGWLPGESISSRATSSHSQGIQGQISSTITQESRQGICTLLLMLVYLLGMASSILTLNWFFTAASRCNKGEGGKLSDVRHTDLWNIGVFLLTAFVLLMCFFGATMVALGKRTRPGTPPASKEAHLVMDDRGSKKYLLLQAKATGFYVGSSTDDDSQINHPSVKAEHLSFFYEDGDWMIADLNCHGVWQSKGINTLVRLEPLVRHVIKHGTILHLGSKEGLSVTFQINSDEEAAPAKRTRDNETRSLEVESLHKLHQQRHQQQLKALRDALTKKDAECTKLKGNVTQLSRQKAVMEKNEDNYRAEVQKLEEEKEKLRNDKAKEVRKLEAEKVRIAQHLVIEQKQKEAFVLKFNAAFKVLQERFTVKLQENAALKKNMQAFCTLLQHQMGEMGEMVDDAGQKVKNPIVEEFECSICKEYMVEPMVLSCVHMFCAKCITTWRKTHTTCPNCRAPIAASFKSANNEELALRVTG